MRVTTLIRKLIGVPGTRVTEVAIEDGALVAHVRPNWTEPRCGRCGKRPPRQRKGGAEVATRGRRWRHLDLAGVRLYLSFDTQWVYCPLCGRTVEDVPWSSTTASRYTDAFEEHVAYMAQRCDKTAVRRLLRIAWESVGRCVERVVGRLRPSNPLTGLTAIGVDELSYRKHHHYVTLVTDQLNRRIVWGKEGRKAKTLEAFFQELGEEGREKIALVCIDMSAAYAKAVSAQVPHAQLVYDRFHVQKLASEALDETRRQEWNRLRREHGKKSAEARALKGLRWALLRHELTLYEAERTRIAELQKDNKRLYRGYLLKAELGDILDRRQPNVVRALLLRWCSWASRSRLSEFVRVGKTVRKHLDGIVAYVRWQVTNGPAEGLNNKARLLTRRAYGFHSAEAVLALIMLCCSGLEIAPRHLQLA